jgi:hypothetical protein
MVFTMQYSQMLDLRDKFNDTILAEMNQLWLQALQAYIVVFMIVVLWG